MKRTPKILALTAGVIVLAGGLSVAAFAHPGGGGGRGFHRGGKMIGMPGMRMLALAESLDLTEEQEVAAVRMRRSIREEAKLNHQQMQGAFSEVLAELEKPNPDPAKLH